MTNDDHTSSIDTIGQSNVYFYCLPKIAYCNSITVWNVAGKH